MKYLFQKTFFSIKNVFLLSNIDNIKKNKKNILKSQSFFNKEISKEFNIEFNKEINDVEIILITRLFSKNILDIKIRNSHFLSVISATFSIPIASITLIIISFPSS